MIGPLYNVSTVPQRPNLHWLGFKNYEELPDYARCFDVGIIPFKNSSMIDAVNPIKMWEYLAAGMPVVTTAVPEAKKYEGILFYSQDEEAFLTNIQLALRDNSYLRREERLALARQNSWDARAERIIALIEYHLDKKYPQMMSSLLRIPDIKPFREQMVRADGAYGASPIRDCSSSACPAMDLTAFCPPITIHTPTVTIWAKLRPFLLKPAFRAARDCILTGGS